VPAVEKALALLPRRPGVYILRDSFGRVIYVGRSGDLATRVRSYWGDLADRPHLVRMVERVAWLEPVVCASEHEAAFLESDLLARHRTRYNRTLGMESCVWLRLDANPRTPGLEVAHEACPADGASWFGPYLGWEPVRQAAAGLARLYPLRHTGSRISRSDREMARSLGVSEADRETLVAAVDRVLRRDAAAVGGAVRELEALRDRAARLLMFEQAEQLQRQLRGLRKVAEPQKLAGLEPVDHDFLAVAGAGAAAVLVILALRSGRLLQREVVQLKSVSAWSRAVDERLRRRNPRDATPVAVTPPHAEPRPGTMEREWVELARENAELMARLSAAGALGPLGWRV